MPETFEMTTGAIPSPRDYRDIPLAAVGPGEDPVYAASMPKEHFEDVNMLPIWHQRKIGACVGHSAAKYKQHLDRKETGNIIPYSPRFLYAISKARDGFPQEGTPPRVVAKILKDIGCATEAEVPNDTTIDHETYVYNRNESKVPGKDKAAPGQIGGYAFPNVKDELSLKKAIIEYGGAMLLMQVGKEWWTGKNGLSTWAANEIVPIRPPSDVVSGHEVYLYGFDVHPENGRTRFYIINSWSLEWGLQGKAWFYFDEYRPYLTEAITFVDIPNDLKKRVSELPEAQKFRWTFDRDIVAGERGEHVKALQTALMIDGQFDKELYAELLRDNALGYFKPGGATQKALLAYQLKHLVPKGSTVQSLLTLNGSRCGPATRAALNSQFSG